MGEPDRKLCHRQSCVLFQKFILTFVLRFGFRFFRIHEILHCLFARLSDWRNSTLWLGGSARIAVMRLLGGGASVGSVLYLGSLHLFKLLLGKKYFFGTCAELAEFYHLVVELLAKGKFTRIGRNARHIQCAFNLRLHVGTAETIAQKETNKGSPQRNRTDQYGSASHINPCSYSNLNNNQGSFGEGQRVYGTKVTKTLYEIRGNWFRDYCVFAWISREFDPFEFTSTVIQSRRDMQLDGCL